jgi:SAM-dependent MidA family methyltransferase
LTSREPPLRLAAFMVRSSSHPLADLIAREIRASGPIPFRRFMELALYHPELGYYGSGRARIGREGDYFTNVSVGPLFGELIGRQFREMWERLGRPTPFTVVEQGANSGDFARDVLAWAGRGDRDFREALHYAIVEPFPVQRDRQRQTLEGHASGVSWHADLAELPRFTGVHFSNELLDAFPVHRLRSDGSRWLERHVAMGEDGEFAFTDGPLTTPPAHPLPEVAPAGFETEVCPAALEWCDALSGRLERGYALAIDYGFSRSEYFAPDRRDGTLSAYRDHRREENPLARPGETDLTAHVEFTTLVGHALGSGGFELAGFTDQHHFMVGLGRVVFPDSDVPPTPEERKARRAFATLMHPGLMGRGFKVLALSRGVSESAPLLGFQWAGRHGLFD